MGACQGCSRDVCEIERVNATTYNKRMILDGVFSSGYLDDGEGISDSLDFRATCYDVFAIIAEKYPHRACFGSLIGSKYVYQTYYGVLEDVIIYASSLEALQVSPKTFFVDDEHGSNGLRLLGIMGVNSSIYAKTMISASRQNITTVPLYATLGRDTLKSVIQECRLTSFAIDLQFYSTLNEVINEIFADHSATLSGSLTVSNGDYDFTSNSNSFYILLLDSDAKIAKSLQENVPSALPLGTKWRVLSVVDDLWPIGRQVNVEESVCTSDDISTICYTSGSTGSPKGVKLSHKNILAGTAGFLRAFIGVTGGRGFCENDVHFSYLPFAHIFERCLFEAFISVGARIAFQTGGSTKLLEEMVLAAPTKFFGVPRVYLRLKSAIDEILDHEGLAYCHKSHSLKSKSDFNYYSLFKTMRMTEHIKNRVFGSSGIHSLVCGAAVLSPQLKRFFRVCTGITVCSGYGLTETVGAGALTCQTDLNSEPVLGCVGGLFASMICRIDHEGEGGGELWLSGKNVFEGYFRNEKETHKVLVEWANRKWLRTGDIAEISVEDGSWNGIRLLDRKKNLIKLSNGEMIAPECIEALLMASAEITGLNSVFVTTGNAFQDHNWCVIAVAEGYPKADVCLSELMHQILCEDGGMPRYAKPKAVLCISQLFHGHPTFASLGLLTAAGKLRREEAKRIFLPYVDAWFEEEKNGKKS
eukprot:GDKJ01001033.1.p1 GENE.GDKJ01001033.1~~GDKJ01001033.1.p1  ORF type:complete len:699 (-),score=96.04 GDKJ01001033.1:36-2132(-)